MPGGLQVWTPRIGGFKTLCQALLPVLLEDLRRLLPGSLVPLGLDQHELRGVRTLVPVHGPLVQGALPLHEQAVAPVEEAVWRLELLPHEG
eukprot:13322701-Alexandrium_andersonii.AAC.1